jgi:Ras family protein U
VREKWIPELRTAVKSSKHVPVILVGTQSDLRTDVKTLVELAKHKEQPVTESEAKKLSASLGCAAYIESSALTQTNLKEVFDEAIVCGLRHHRQKESKAAARLKKSGGGCLGCQCVLM